MKKLLIVDVQKGFINENNSFLVKSIENLINSNVFDQIFATKFINHPKSQFVEFLNWHKLMEKSELDFAIQLPSDVTVLEKTSYSLEAGGGIQFNKTDKVYLCGTDYDACILAIAYQLFDSGIKPYILINYVGSASKNPLNKEEFIKLFKRNFGEDSVIETF